jgi:hypothetical protein
MLPGMACDNQIGQIYVAWAGVRLGTLSMPPMKPLLGVNEAPASSALALPISNTSIPARTAWTGVWPWSWTTSGNAIQVLEAYDPGNNFAFEAHQYLDADGSGTSPNCVAGAGEPRPFPAGAEPVQLKT